MTDLRNSVFILITFLIVVFGISNIESFEDNVLNFHPAFFIMMMLAAFGGILITSRISLYLYMGIWVAIYVLMWLFFFRLLPDPRNVQELGVQFILIEISAGLSYFVGRQVQQIDVLVKGLSVSAYPNRTLELSQARELIGTELTRSRRYRRPLTALVFELEHIHQTNGMRQGEAIQRDLLRRFALAKMGQIINEFARQTDLILTGPSDQFILLCPETDLKNSTTLAERIRQSVDENMGAKMTWGAASFPQDALTFDDLVEQAKHRLGSFSPTPAIVDHSEPESGEVE